MTELAYVEGPLPAVRLAQLTGSVRDQADLGALVGPMFQRLHEQLPAAGIAQTGPDLAWYDASGEEIHFGVGLPVGDEVEDVPVEGVEVPDLPPAPRALTVTHHGAMDAIGDTWGALLGEVAARGLTPSAPGREVYLRAESPDQQDWVTELQQPVA